MQSSLDTRPSGSVFIIMRCLEDPRMTLALGQWRPSCENYCYVNLIPMYKHARVRPASIKSIVLGPDIILKGKLRKEREKCKRTSHHLPQCAKWLSRYPISKSGIWARRTSSFCRLSASFSLKYDVTDEMLQGNEKMKVQYLRSLMFDLFETSHAIRT